jgi:hypothetical protein
VRQQQQQQQQQQQPSINNLNAKIRLWPEIVVNSRQTTLQVAIDLSDAITQYTDRYPLVLLEVVIS